MMRFHDDRVSFFKPCFYSKKFYRYKIIEGVQGPRIYRFTIRHAIYNLRLSMEYGRWSAWLKLRGHVDFVFGLTRYRSSNS